VDLSQESNQNLIQAMVGDLQGLELIVPGSFVVSQSSLDDPAPSASGQENSSSTLNGIPSLPPGTILYAVTELAVNSDVPAPVMARVVEGKLLGARFMGGFNQYGENLTLSFSQMSFPGSGTQEVAALAVDPKTDSPVMSGKIDRHLLSRWGGLIASGFLEGFGGALSNRGTTVSVNGDVVSVGRENIDYGQISLEALGQVGSRASTQLEKNFDRPPTVTIPAGSAIGLLILSAKD
jgi:type IV secretory pathway VirB10-like protein